MDENSNRVSFKHVDRNLNSTFFFLFFQDVICRKDPSAVLRAVSRLYDLIRAKGMFTVIRFDL